MPWGSITFKNKLRHYLLLLSIKYNMNISRVSLYMHLIDKYFSVEKDFDTNPMNKKSDFDQPTTF